MRAHPCFTVAMEPSLDLLQLLRTDLCEGICGTLDTRRAGDLWIGEEFDLEYSITCLEILNFNKAKEIGTRGGIAEQTIVTGVFEKTR